MPHSTNNRLLRTAISAAAFVVCYAWTLGRLVDQWTTNATLSYGFAVPLISGYIVWVRWSRVKAAFGNANHRKGLPLIVLGLLLLSAGRLGAITSLETTSMIPTVTGLVMVVGGTSLLRVLAFPLSYLFLMLPVWHHFFIALEPQSQRLSAAIATHLLRAFGIPALHSGTKIVLASATLDVMPECSGINQLIALTIMALPAAYLWLGTSTSRVTLVVIAVFAGYLSNGTRIALLGWLASNGLDISESSNPIHLLPGFATASLGYVIVGVAVARLAKLTPLQTPPDRTMESAAVPSASITQRRLWLDATTVVLMLAVGAGQLIAMPLVQPFSNRVQLLPTRIGGWTMSSAGDPLSNRFPGFDVDLLGAYPTASGQRRFQSMDDELLRTYRNENGASVDVYIGYYRRQEDHKELVTDVSQLLERAAASVDISMGSHAVTLGEITRPFSDGGRGLVFWYDVDGRVLNSVYEAKLYTLWNTIAKRRSDGAVVMIAWNTASTGESGREEALAFAKALLSVLELHLRP